MQELQDEADLRNSDGVEIDSEGKSTGPVSQQDLPPLLGWRVEAEATFGVLLTFTARNC